MVGKQHDLASRPSLCWASFLVSHDNHCETIVALLFANRFLSNGPVWSQDLAIQIGVALLDYATGGATADNNIVQGYTVSLTARSLKARMIDRTQGL